MEKPPEIVNYLQHRLNLRVLKYAEDIGSCKKACNAVGVNKINFYSWKKKFKKEWRTWLVAKKREYETYGNCLSPDVVELILKLRSEYKLGTWRIK